MLCGLEGRACARACTIYQLFMCLVREIEMKRILGALKVFTRVPAKLEDCICSVNLLLKL